MGNAFQRQENGLTHDELRHLKSLTGFSCTQLHRLFRRFRNLDKEGKGFLVKSDLLQVNEIVLNPIGERIVDMFAAHSRQRQRDLASTVQHDIDDNVNNNNGVPVMRIDAEALEEDCDEEDDTRIYFEDFARTFATFRPIDKSTTVYAVNSREAKIQYLFNLVDSCRDGQITVDNLHDLLEQMMGAKVEEDQLHQIAERIVREADKSGDGRVTFQEFQEATKELDVAGRMSFISFS